jgi:hypothetical protein
MQALVESRLEQFPVVGMGPISPDLQGPASSWAILEAWW